MGKGDIIQNLERRVSRLERQFADTQNQDRDKLVNTNRLKADFDQLINFLGLEKVDIPASSKYVKKGGKK